MEDAALRSVPGKKIDVLVDNGLLRGPDVCQFCWVVQWMGCAACALGPYGLGISMKAGMNSTFIFLRFMYSLFLYIQKPLVEYDSPNKKEMKVDFFLNMENPLLNNWGQIIGQQYMDTI